MAQDITRTSLKIHPYMNLGARLAYNPRDIPEANNHETRLITRKLIADAWDLFSSGTSRQFTEFSLIY